MISAAALPQSMEALKPILIGPLVASLITGLIMITWSARRSRKIMEGLTHCCSRWHAPTRCCGAIGAMMCTDMAPRTKRPTPWRGAAQFRWRANGGDRAAGMVPADRWRRAAGAPSSETERRKAALVLGLCFISEGSVRRPRSDARAALLHCGGADRKNVDGVRCQLMAARRAVRAADPRQSRRCCCIWWRSPPVPCWRAAWPC